MTSQEWPHIWEKISEFLRSNSSISTLKYNVINNIVHVDENGVAVYSTRSGKEDFISVDEFKTWWIHLVKNRRATVDTNDPNTPKTKRSSVICAIYASCLSDLIESSTSPKVSVRLKNDY